MTTTAIEAALVLLHEPGAVFEVRIPKTGRAGTLSGYYNDPAKAAADIAMRDGRAPGVYFTLNPVNPALMARAANRLRERTDLATSDKDVTRRRWLLIDVDYTRPTGISATDDELKAAGAVARKIKAYLEDELGWPAGVLVHSGNGGHILYRIDLPNDDASRDLLKNVLLALAGRFDVEDADGTLTVHVDTGVFNAARIAKVPGTMACKGDNLPARPHRRSRILAQPETLEVVSAALLAALVSEALSTVANAPTTKPAGLVARDNGHGDPFDVEDFIRRNGLDTRKEKHDSNGDLWELQTCPFNAEHNNGEAFIRRDRDGTLSAGCQHATCGLKTWHDLREKYEPGYRDRRQPEVVTVTTSSSTVTGKDGKTARFALTDLGNGERLAARYGDRLRYENASGKWRYWDGRRWAYDGTLRVDEYAARTARAIYEEASQEEALEVRRLVTRHAQTSESRDRQQAMIASARHMLAVAPSDFDADPWLVNCENGTVDLRTGLLRPHRREDLITMLAPVEYDPEAPAALFEAFISEILPDPEVREHVQRAAGCSVSGVIREHHFWFALGVGANGKSTLLNLLLAILGDYAAQAPPDLLITSRGRHPTEIAFLRGARLVVATETQEGSRLNEERVKELTGGDMLTARFMRGDFFTFKPTHTLWMVGNHRPQISGTDVGIWRRPLLVDFPVSIPPERQDHELPEKLLTEAPGVLRWIVDGCLAWQRQGLRPPRAVVTATQAYRLDMDVVGQWLEEKCIEEPDAGAGSSVLYRDYTNWCESNGERPMKQRDLGRRLLERGFTKSRSTGGRYIYSGLRLSSEPSEPSEPLFTIDSSKKLHEEVIAKVGSLGSLSSKKPTVDPETPSCLPGHRRFWRHGRGDWKCAICRPPSVPEGAEYIDLDEPASTEVTG